MSHTLKLFCFSYDNINVLFSTAVCFPSAKTSGGKRYRVFGPTSFEHKQSVSFGSQSTFGHVTSLQPISFCHRKLRPNLEASQVLSLFASFGYLHNIFPAISRHLKYSLFTTHCVSFPPFSIYYETPYNTQGRVDGVIL